MSNPDHQPTRREILGGGIVKAAIEGHEDAESPDQFENLGPLFHYSGNAMGCEFQLLCSGSGREALANLVDEAFQLVAGLEQQMSIYRAGSELSTVNRLAGAQPVPIESGLFELLAIANQISEATDGAFDISATPLSRLWKMHRGERSLPTEQAIQKSLAQIGYQKIILDADNQAVSFADERVQLDLGGIGKGYALDRLNDLALNNGCTYFIFHGGQSSVMAWGERSSMDGKQKGPWKIGITHPLSPGIRLANLKLANRAIGTSGSGRKSFVVGGKSYGHIIDPRTGWPANRLVSVTVVAPTAVLADALATAIFVLGKEHAQTLCDRYGLSAVLIGHDAGQQSLEIERFNVDDGEFELLI